MGSARPNPILIIPADGTTLADAMPGGRTMNDDAIDAFTFAWSPRARDAVTPESVADALGRQARLRAMGVDPDRVIDGETVQKEIDGGRDA